MGASLGCFRSGPDPDVELIAARYMHGVHGAKRCSSYAALQSREQGVLGKLQRTLSFTVAARGRSEASGRHSTGGGGGGGSGGGARSRDLASAARSSSSGRDADALARSYSSASGTSGSRMLSDFYNLVLESERSAFFKDKHGKRATGAYLDEVRIIDEYFVASRRKRQRPRAADASAAAQRHAAALEPKLPILERFAHLPTALMSASSTISSEMDYWSCLDSMAPEHDDMGAEMSAVRRYDSATAAMNGLLLFSPVNAESAGGAGGAMARRLSRSLSPRNSWPARFGGGAHFGREPLDDDDDDDSSSDSDGKDVGSQSAYGYSWDRVPPAPASASAAVRRPKDAQLETHWSLPPKSAPTATGAGQRAPIFFTPDAARNERSVAPMSAS